MTKQTPPTSSDPTPFKPRPRLLWITAIFLSVWIILLLVIYFTVVR